MRHQRMYRDIVETSPDGIWVIDLEGRTLYANPSLAAMYGVDVDDMADVTVFGTLDDAGREQFRGHLRDLRNGQFNEAAVECLFHDKDGSARWMLLPETRAYDADGTVVGAVHRYYDYTERRQVSLELAESQSRSPKRSGSRGSAASAGRGGRLDRAVRAAGGDAGGRRVGHPADLRGLPGLHPSRRPRHGRRRRPERGAHR